MRSIKAILLLAVFAASLRAQVVTGGLLPSRVNAVYTFGPGLNGAICNNSTDDTAAFNALLSAVNTAGGGSIEISGGCLIAGAVVFPNNGAMVPSQSTIEIYGYGNTTSELTTHPLPTARSFLNLTFNASVAKLDTRGRGQLIIHDLNLIDTASDCAAFIQTTNTGLTIYDVSFSGTGNQASACNDAIVLGGTTTTIDGSSASPFQGYHTEIRNNYFDQVRRVVYGRVYANGARVYSNTVAETSGSNLTAPISACTNANPTVCTVAGIGLFTGATYTLRVSGATGPWAAINGAKAVVPISINTFSITGVDATAFGALAGSPVYLNGAAIEFNGITGTNAVAGNVISYNLVEVSNYAYGIKLNTGLENQIYGNNFFDASILIAYYRLENLSKSNLILHGFGQDAFGSLFTDDAVNGTNTFINPHGVGANPNPFQFNQIRAAFDGPQGIQLQNNLGTVTVLNIDTTNNRVGIGTTTPAQTLDIVLSAANSKVQISAPAANTQGGNFTLRSNIDVSPVTGVVGLDNAGDLVVRSNNGPVFFDYIANLFMRAGAGSGGTQFTLSSTFLTAGVPILAAGTKFTISGCSAGTTVGGSFAGSFLSGTTGACSVVITPGGTATTGWVCHADDLTTPANLISQSASSQTTCTVTGTTISGDKIQWSGVAF